MVKLSLRKKKLRREGSEGGGEDLLSGSSHLLQNRPPGEKEGRRNRPNARKGRGLAGLGKTSLSTFHFKGPEKGDPRQAPHRKEGTWGGKKGGVLIQASIERKNHYRKSKARRERHGK